MIRVYIDLPVFSSPTEAFGLATGEIDIAFLPNESGTFPWPDGWLHAQPAYFSKYQSAVMGIRPWDLSPTAKTHVSLYGIVCDNDQDARRCANFLESKGLQFHDYQVEA